MPDERAKIEPYVARSAGELIGLHTRTSLVLYLSLMGHTVRVETNSATILAYLERLRKSRLRGSPKPEFVWRLVSDPEAVSHAPWPLAAGLADGPLRLATFGRCNFIAADFESREAVAFVADELIQDAVGFHNLFLPALCSLTADGLGLDIGVACGDLMDVTDQGLP